MDIASLSQSQLLQLIVFLGASSVIFAVIFIVTVILTLRRRTAKLKKEETLVQKKSLQTAMPQTTITMGEDMGLLKSTGEKETLRPQQENDTSRMELLSLWINPQTKEISVKVEDRYYAALTDIVDRHIGQRILESAAALLAFTRGIIATSEGTKTLPIPKVAMSEIAQLAKVHEPPVAPAEENLDADEVARQQFLERLAAQEGSLNIVEPTPIPEKKLRWGFRRKNKTPETPQSLLEPFNLVEQIDEILQQKLLAVGETRQVSIQSVPSGGMRIHVGDKVYDALDAVAEADIKMIIQSAIKTWEAR